MKLFFTRINECNIGWEDWQWALLLLFSWFSNFIYYCIVTLGFHIGTALVQFWALTSTLKHYGKHLILDFFFSFKETRIKSTQGLAVCLTKTQKGTFSLVCHFKLLNIIIIEQLTLIYLLQNFTATWKYSSNSTDWVFSAVIQS